MPLFNEEKHIPLIRKNIKLILHLMPESVIFFNDNHSTDGTYEKLLIIKNKWPNKIFIHRQSSNIGFSRNIAHFGNASVFLKEKSRVDYFQFLGQSDIITKEGLLHLRNQVNNRIKANLIISNYIYTEKKGGKVNDLGDYEIENKKICTSLEEYFSNRFYIPGGIMQYCLCKDKLVAFKEFEKEISPHVGVFFKCFPGRVVCASSPGLCRVSKAESSGWRSSPYSVFKMLTIVFGLYIRLIKKAFQEKQITNETFQRLIKEYTRLSWLIFKECREGLWGVWAPTKTEKLCISFLLLKGLMRGSFFQSLANLRYLQKNISKEYPCI